MIESKPGTGSSNKPADIAALYSAAAGRGGRYRDFSASSNETRVQFHHRVLREQAAPVRAARWGPAVEESPAEAQGPPPQDPVPALLRAESGDERLSQVLPQWFHGEREEAVYGAAAGGEALEQARERLASRWFVLKGIFARPGEPTEAPPQPERPEGRVSVAAFFSLAGGVGKTSMVATLGRALAAHGERVLLADTTHYGLLPFYFGSRELKPGVIRSFSPPEGGSDAPIHAVALDAEQQSEENDERDPLLEELARYGQGSHRILVDIATAAIGVACRLLRLAPTVVVPILPDMNSVATLRSVEDFFGGTKAAEGPAIEPVYLLNQFDPSLPLHLDVREILEQRLGDRLLPFVLRRSPQLSEALAEGMTVMDYAPISPAAEDYARFAIWLRSVSAPAPAAVRGLRWSEQ